MPLLLNESTITETTVAASPALSVPRGRPRCVTWKERALSGVAALANDFCGPREKQAFGILMYHRIINPPPGKPKPTWNVPPRRFEQQLKGLLARGWQAWPLKQVLSCCQRGLPIPR